MGEPNLDDTFRVDTRNRQPPNNPRGFTPSVPQFWGKGFIIRRDSD